MLEYIKGEVAELGPTHLVIELNGIGYGIHISLFSFSQIQGQKHAKLFLHEVIREDAHLLYGFVDTVERNIFRLLLSVSGVGANTSRMILSAMTPDEVSIAIANEQVDKLKSIKGIGAKTAQRIIIDLKDKIQLSTDSSQILRNVNNTVKIEALSALEVLGFNKKLAEKVVDQLLLDDGLIKVEDLIKKALKLL